MVKEEDLQDKSLSENALVDKIEEVGTSEILDVDNPRSLVSICPPNIKELILELPMHLLVMNERELDLRAKPTQQMNMVRLGFWQEYEAAQSDLRQMRMSEISRRSGMPTPMIMKRLREQIMLAYILCPPVSYDTFLTEALDKGLSRLREILDLPLQNPDGSINNRVAELHVKVTAFIDMRKNGGIVQKTMNLNVDAKTSVAEVRKMAKDLSVDELDRKIKQLEERKMLDITRSENIDFVKAIEVRPSERMIEEME